MRGPLVLFGAWLLALAPVLAADPASTYASLSALPDLSGWWHIQPQGPPALLRMLAKPPPLRVELLSRFREALAARMTRVGTDFCRPLQFVGVQNGSGFEDTLELLFTPGRVTLTTETGLIRRIYTDGRPLPVDPDETNTGTSVGHWEGEILVVETTGLAHTAQFPERFAGAVPIGRGARVTERISLKRQDMLEIRSVLIAPDLMAAPYETTTFYVRETGYVAHELTNCPDSDRLIDPITHLQRFDLTPPADLPPPPSSR
jgi:hypothetical protein